MRRLRTTLSMLLSVVVLAAGLLAVPMACEASGSTCKMGCGMEISSGGCCCHVDQQNSASQPAKTALNVPPLMPKLSPASGAFACAFFQAISPLHGISTAAMNLLPARGGLAFLGIFLI